MRQSGSYINDSLNMNSRRGSQVYKTLAQDQREDRTDYPCSSKKQSSHISFNQPCKGVVAIVTARENYLKEKEKQILEADAAFGSLLAQAELIKSIETTELDKLISQERNVYERKQNEARLIYETQLALLKQQFEVSILKLEKAADKIVNLKLTQLLQGDHILGGNETIEQHLSKKLFQELCTKKTISNQGKANRAEMKVKVQANIRSQRPSRSPSPSESRIIKLKQEIRELQKQTKLENRTREQTLLTSRSPSRVSPHLSTPFLKERNALQSKNPSQSFFQSFTSSDDDLDLRRYPKSSHCTTTEDRSPTKWFLDDYKKRQDSRLNSTILHKNNHSHQWATSLKKQR